MLKGLQQLLRPLQQLKLEHRCLGMPQGCHLGLILGIWLGVTSEGD